MFEIFWLFFSILFLEYYSLALILKSVLCEWSEQALEFIGPEWPEILVHSNTQTWFSLNNKWWLSQAMSYFLVLFQSLCDLCCLNSVLVCKAFSIFCNVKGLAECQRNYGGNDERTGGEFISQTRQLAGRHCMIYTALQWLIYWKLQNTLLINSHLSRGEGICSVCFLKIIQFILVRPNFLLKN